MFAVKHVSGFLVFTNMILFKLSFQVQCWCSSQWFSAEEWTLQRECCRNSWFLFLLAFCSVNISYVGISEKFVQGQMQALALVFFSSPSAADFLLHTTFPLSQTERWWNMCLNLDILLLQGRCELSSCTF